jgi:hypothetical protein
MKPGVVYVCGEDDCIWCVAFVCPCGCGRAVNIPVLPGKGPRWDLTVAEDKRVTLTPSLQRTCECKSHFFLTKGEIKWCGPTPKGAL